FFGLTGLMVMGKQSIFGVTFMMMMVAELLDEEEDLTVWAKRVGIALSAAIGLGSITLPYSIVIVGGFWLLALGRIRPFGFLFWLFALAGVSLATSIAAVTKASPLFIALGLGALLAVLYSL